MRRTRNAWHLLLAASFLQLAPLSASIAQEEGADTRVETAAERAHFAQEFCGTSADQIKRFKARMKEVLVDAQDFDIHWARGWKREEFDATMLRSLRLSDPTEYAKRVKSSCSRVMWQAENSMRKRSK